MAISAQAAVASQDTGTNPPAPNGDRATIEAAINDAKLTDMASTDKDVSPAIVRAEILLDRANDSPGVIDGKAGANFSHALEAFETQRHLPPTRTLDAKSWTALLAVGGPPVLTTYTLTDADVAGPFFPDLPRDYSKLAELPTIGYRNVAQKISAKFHLGEALLAYLNPGVDLSKSGTAILVSNVAPEPVSGTVSRVTVDKAKRQVFGYNKDHELIFSAPATIGSRELPSPSGTYKVKGVSWNPVYYYNPKNFVQGHNHRKLRLPPGPNNPVGSVFIALTKPTYGLHGTPDPSKIDKTASHGCVRMTNWDAVRLAHLVRFGTIVHFSRNSSGADQRLSRL